MLALNKAVSLISSDGAASTVIDARSVVDVNTNVLLITDGGEFGRPAKGFTVTNTGSPSGSGIAIDSNGVSVRGNQVVNLEDGLAGIVTVDSPGVVLIDGNQVIGWLFDGIHTRGNGKTVRKNQVSLSGTGIFAAGSTTVVGNVVTLCRDGIVTLTYATAIGNSTHGNDDGFYVPGPSFSGRIEKNNVFGNLDCGLDNRKVPGLLAQNNYWGAATGPGGDPADDVCNQGAGTTTVIPFATKPFKVKAPIKP
jgi:hypothetical protein